MNNIRFAHRIMEEQRKTIEWNYQMSFYETWCVEIYLKMVEK